MTSRAKRAREARLSVAGGGRLEEGSRREREWAARPILRLRVLKFNSEPLSGWSKRELTHSIMVIALVTLFTSDSGLWSDKSVFPWSTLGGGRQGCLQEMQCCALSSLSTVYSPRALKQVAVLLRGGARQIGEVLGHRLMGIFVQR